VHQDGLVHVSAMSKTFVKDPRDVVTTGDVVKVKVMDVDAPRQRISLTLRLDDEVGPRQPRDEQPRGERPGQRAGQGARPDRGAPGSRPERGTRPESAGQGGRPQGSSGQGSRGGQSGPSRQGNSSGQKRAAAPDTALADALRRAGLLNE
jgi:protein Tex